MGAVRVVPARELSLDEIHEIKDATGMEIECFVHGALCYCYSGQCLLSSLIGGRSGNRGQCAQPCRLPYSASGESGYLLSLKDICTLDLIPELIQAGIDSFKIEGRMKRPEYVAGVTAMYRKYTDRYLANPNAPYHVDAKDKEILMDLFNRGGFHSGYYTQKNGRDMITLEKPGHAGVAVGKVLGQKGREVTVRAMTEIHKGDLIDFSKAVDYGNNQKSAPQSYKKPLSDYETGNGYTCGMDCKKGDSIVMLAPKGVKVKSGCFVYRTRNQQLLDTVAAEYIERKKQEKIYGFLNLSVGKHAKLIVCRDTFSVEAETEMNVSAADKRPLEEERIRRQMLKTGNTEFVFEQLDIEIDGDVFLPMQQLNELRRTALELLEKQICEGCHRETKNRQLQMADRTDVIPSLKVHENIEPYCSVLVETKEQLEALKPFSEIQRIYLDYSIDDGKLDGVFWREQSNIWKAKGTEVFLALPRIFRKQTAKRFEGQAEILKNGLFDGVLVRTYEEYEFLKAIKFDRSLILDHNLYVMNRYAKEFWKKESVYNYTIPVELNKQEIERLGAESGEMIVYGYLPAMVSAQCVTATINGCRKTPQVMMLTDRYRNEFPMKNFCSDCYNVIYNTKALLLFDQMESLKELHAESYRLQFTVENGKETREILNLFFDCFETDYSPVMDSDLFTKGHFRRGIS